MPIVIKDYSWVQNDNLLVVRVPLHGCHPSKADIICTSGYIKTSFEQFFFEIFPLFSIDTDLSRCTKTTTEIIFELFKAKAEEWPSLEQTDLDKQSKRQRRQKYLEEHSCRVQTESVKKQELSNNLKRLTVREQIALDTRNRDELATRKEREKQKAIEVFKKPIETLKKSTCVPKNSLIPIRNKCSVSVTFTPREFPTPSRESRRAEELEWLKNQAEARRATGFMSEDLRPEERNPMYLKLKGDEFLANGNFLGAISAYSYGLQISPKYVDMYLGRAKAHSALENYKKLVEDCSAALELLQPALKVNLVQRAWCLGMRGSGLIDLGMIQQGISELQHSLQLKPDAEQFQRKLNDALDFKNCV